jgi:predicted nucleic acid-binding protein
VNVVSNASPLISLSKLDLLPVLANLFGTILIAEEVFQEIVVVGTGRPAADAVQNATWIRSQPCRNTEKLAQWKSHYRLGAGELATILLAAETSADLILIDERSARKLASALGLKVIGCVGVLEIAARKGLLTDLRATYQKMLASGTRIDPQILNRSLATLNLPAL